MTEATHFSENQAKTIKRLQELFPNIPCVLVGASAIGRWLDYQWRQTADLDLCPAARKSLGR